jgi:hypothetical protein
MPLAVRDSSVDSWPLPGGPEVPAVSLVRDQIQPVFPLLVSQGDVDMSETLTTAPASTADTRPAESTKERASVSAVMESTSGAAKKFQDAARRRMEDELERVRFQYD